MPAAAADGPEVVTSDRPEVVFDWPKADGPGAVPDGPDMAAEGPEAELDMPAAGTGGPEAVTFDWPEVVFDWPEAAPGGPEVTSGAWVPVRGCRSVGGLVRGPWSGGGVWL